MPLRVTMNLRKLIIFQTKRETGTILMAYTKLRNLQSIRMELCNKKSRREVLKLFSRAQWYHMLHNFEENSKGKN